MGRQDTLQRILGMGVCFEAELPPKSRAHEDHRLALAGNWEGNRMISGSTNKAMIACMALACLISVLSGCGGRGGDNTESTMLNDDLVLVHDPLLRPPESHPAAGENGNEPGTPNSPAMPADTTTTRAAPEPERSTSQSGVLSDTTEPGGASASEGLASSGTVTLTGTTPGSGRLAERPRNNPEAADLLDHWGHRQSYRITEGLALSDPVNGDSAADLRALRTAAQRSSETVTPDLHDGDEVEVLGIHRGVTYGRWTGGPADTLSVEFDLSRAASETGENSEFRATLERAGKAWSRRIADTWTTWERPAGDLKGLLLNDGSRGAEVRVGKDGESSTGLEIYVTVGNLSGIDAGKSTQSTGHSPGDSWEPHFAAIEIDRTHLQEAGEATLFATLAHEIGHTLGAWMGGTLADRYVSYTDRATGTWTGPNVVALHGGDAPFQDASDPRAWVDGERNPLASQYDFSHSGVCVSLMSYCRQSAAVPAFLPHAIDFAFLSDLGVTVTEETDRPETYGLAGWTDYAAFTLSLSRELEIALADPQPHYDGPVNPWRKLDVVDLLQVGVDAFGHRTTGTHAANLSGTARYAGGLIGAALDRTGLPPVTGDASLALDLGSLDGTASFTSLLVHPDGIPETFAGGTLHYPFGLSDNAIVGTGTGLTLRADFYGPGHQEVAGILHDPQAGLLASFGATTDDRPSREDVIAAADYMAGTAYRRGAATEADNGWYDYRCEPESACESRHNGSDGWTEWTETTREQVLASTAAWAWRDASRPVRDRGFVRIARLTSAATDGSRGRYAVDGYAATLAYAAFGVGFERYTDEWTDSEGTPPGFGNRWVGFQGSLADSLPDGIARWSGPMLGYQEGRAAGDNPFVEGLATVKFSLSDNQVDVLISEVTSRDQRRIVPDFGFEDLPAQADGTFEGFRSGSIEGAIFGPSHEEAAGSFYHNPTHVAGSFGARRLPDTVMLGESGTVRTIGDVDAGTGFYAYDDWGFWATRFEEYVFGAFIEQRIRKVGQTTYYDSTQGRIDGTPAGDNPVSGTAVWSGKVRAFDTQSEASWMPVSGNAHLEVNFGDTTVDVDFTDFEAGYGDMSWRSLRLRAGAFSHTQGQATVDGAFYGSEHQGAAGTFRRDGLRGVFGAVRN